MKEKTSKTPLWLHDFEATGIPPLHICAYGDPTAGKSHLASGMPWPICVWCFDAKGKDMPYWLTRLNCRLNPTLLTDQFGTPYREVFDGGTGKLRVRIEYYHDPVIEQPRAFPRFLDRLANAKKELHIFRTYVLDSLSLAMLSSRKYSQYDLKEDSRDPRHWHGDSVDLIEEIVCEQLPALECNVVLITHVSRIKVEAEGTMVRAPRAQGRVLDMLAACWPETYRVYVDPKTKKRYLQTANDEKWQAATQIGLPDPCRASYQAIAKHIKRGKPLAITREE